MKGVLRAVCEKSFVKRMLSITVLVRVLLLSALCSFRRPSPHAVIYNLGEVWEGCSGDDGSCFVPLIVAGFGGQLPKAVGQWKTLPIGETIFIFALKPFS